MVKFKYHLKALVVASGYSWQGLRYAYKHERAIRLELSLSFIVLPVALLLGDSFSERAILVASWVLVVLLELINSAIEAVVDRISDEKHPLAGAAKDIASAAVFVAVIQAVLLYACALFR